MWSKSEENSSFYGLFCADDVETFNSLSAAIGDALSNARKSVSASYLTGQLGRFSCYLRQPATAGADREAKGTRRR
jgi:hypothetical protein